MNKLVKQGFKPVDSHFNEQGERWTVKEKIFLGLTPNQYFKEQFTIIAKEIASEKVKRQQMSIEELKERVKNLEKKDEDKEAVLTTIHDRIDKEAVQYASDKIRNIKRAIIAGIFIFLIPANILLVFKLPDN